MMKLVIAERVDYWYSVEESLTSHMLGTLSFSCLCSLMKEVRMARDLCSSVLCCVVLLCIELCCVVLRCLVCVLRC